MTPEIKTTLGWLAGSVVGYILSRVMWKKSVEKSIGFDDTIMLSCAALVLSWFLVLGSLAALLSFFLFGGIDSTQAYWFGRKDPELSEDSEWKRSKGV